MVMGASSPKILQCTMRL